MGKSIPQDYRTAHTLLLAKESYSNHFREKMYQRERSILGTFTLQLGDELPAQKDKFVLVGL